MAFLETPRFPVNIQYGSQGGPTFMTDVVKYANGAEYRNQRWSLALHKYNVRYSVRRYSDVINVHNFFLASGGRFDGFRVKDLFDFSTGSNGTGSPAFDDVTIGTGDGNTTSFQLVKTYTKGANTYTRTITKPVASTTVAGYNGSAEAFSVDTTTGIVTFSVAPGVGETVTAGCEFDVPCRFDTDELDIIEFLYYNDNSASDLVSIPNIPLIEIRNA